MDNCPQQTIRSVSRTKALVHGLSLDAPVSIGIESLGNGDSRRSSAMKSVALTAAEIEALGRKRPPPALPMRTRSVDI